MKMRLIRTHEEKVADARDRFKRQADECFSIRNYDGRDYIVRVGEGFYYERVSTGEDSPEVLLKMLNEYRRMYVEDHLRMSGFAPEDSSMEEK